MVENPRRVQTDCSLCCPQFVIARMKTSGEATKFIAKVNSINQISYHIRKRSAQLYLLYNYRDQKQTHLYRYIYIYRYFYIVIISAGIDPDLKKVCEKKKKIKQFWFRRDYILEFDFSNNVVYYQRKITAFSKLSKSRNY